ncbi:MAG TPA: tetratricopeptide repeat protein [Candidatus Polarisedimenticolaceae bacterium]|nr:tetratricopeptide repeat protein [Candidatus Polarisedimenticolaceae bacterium]
MSSTSSRGARRRVAAAAVLAIATFAVYAGALRNGFVYYDDEEYVTANPIVGAGLTPDGIRWAMTATYASNWHPLTWMSHMLDVQMFGLRAGGHHLTSVLLHVANTLLVFALLARATGDAARSGAVALLFGVHPLHVESVAWVSERKDVLGALFALLALVAYVGYVQRPGARRYAAVTAAFVASLMSKPMAVTLPFAMLLLDVWPLRRPWGRRIVVEKVPWLVLSLISSIITLQAQAGAVAADGAISLPARVANAMVSYGRYLRRMIWPSGLTAYSPHPLAWPSAIVLGACALLVAITALALLARRSRPYALVGWLWYLGMLVPVIGLVQVGGQAIADRYMYLPSIGLLVAIAWGTADLLRARRVPRAAGAAALLAVAGLLGVATVRQVATWRDGFALWDHAIRVDPGNAVAWGYRAYARWWAGDLAGTIADYTEALRLKPSFPEAYRERGEARRQHGDAAGARADYDRALALRPDYAAAYNNRGLLRREQGDLDGAIADYLAAIARDPSFAEARNNLGLARLQQGDPARALPELDEAIRLQPFSADAYNNRAAARRQMGDRTGAIEDIEHALRLRPRFVEALAHRALVRREGGDFEGAEADLADALRIDGRNASLYVDRATLRIERSRLAEAISDLDHAVALSPSLARAWLARGVARQMQGDLDGAIADCGRAAELDPGLREARMCRDEALRRQRR